MPVLTEITLRNLKPPERGQKTYTDDNLTGFGVRVSQGGTKTFTLVYGVNRQRVTIGRYPIISLSDARIEAKRILAEHTLGRSRPQTIAWDDGLALFLKHCQEKNRSRTVRDYRRLLKRHFAFGRKKLGEITTADITKRLDRLNETPSERNHALLAVKVFLKWARQPPRSYMSHNPCEGMVLSKRPSRKRVLTDAELGTVYRTALEGEDAFSNIVALLILAGQRRGETGALRREWIDARDRTITLPDSITKNKRTHTFPYGEAAGRIIEAIPEEGEYLFPAIREHVRGKPTTTFNAWSKSKVAFDIACGITGWTLHDIRRTFGTGLARLKVQPHIVERLLNHKLGSIGNQADGVVTAVAEIYNRHLYMEEMREAIAKWEAFLASLLATQHTTSAARAA
jgi:integrase